ncbi:MAG TPA: oxygen-independent coproporphyrinogen III oxidase [Thermoanaerobacterales bacterium]|nr:oxygen-independent coproporphyrinogen III oxidase [Thermoanaerobacterales bacterium]
MKEFSLYIHIPFCVKKCNYCDFNSYAAPELIPSYVEALQQEISFYNNRYVSRQVKTIYIGGGTPTLLNEKDLKSLIKCIRQNFKIKSGAEFTIEANPGTLNLEKLLLLKDLGVSRLSLGLQAFQEKLLKLMGRIHSAKEFEESFRTARQAGFDNINVDVIFGLPEQTVSDFMETIEYVAGLSPEHISCYSLTVEEGTVFHKWQKQGLLKLPVEDEERAMYHKAAEYLKRRGFVHYEISNFAKPGRMCRHNVACWEYEDYLGLGAGAHSFMDGFRFYNHLSPQEYIICLAQKKLPSAETEHINVRDQQAEFCFLGLRLIDGLDKEAFKERFGKDIHQIYGAAIEKLSASGLIEENDRHLKLTSRGLDLANEVFIEFLP